MPLLNTEAHQIILASKSPRRVELLKKIISHFGIKVRRIKENVNGNLSARDFAVQLSQLKARDVSQNLKLGFIIGADSVVVLDNEILGKPRTKTEAAAMLKKLSAKTHQVITGFTVLKMPEQTMVSDFAETAVTFRELAAQEINKYIETNSPFDKAGAYGIQDEAGLFVEKIDGCYFNVMGLPITKLYLVLKDLIK